VERFTVDNHTFILRKISSGRNIIVLVANVAFERAQIEIGAQIGAAGRRGIFGQ
jgi:hypothetical protein